MSAGSLGGAGSAFHRFVLQALDEETACPVLEAKFATADASILQDLLRPEADDDPELHRTYPLGREQTEAVATTFGVPFDPGERPVVLDPWHPIREVPYLVHTDFELALMLDGRKPLAVFHDAYPLDWFDDLVGRFDPYVADGRFVRRVVDRPFSEPRRLRDGSEVQGFREVYIAASGQEWRIDAFALLRDVGAKAGWNDALERFEGSLLGYEDWQNEWWLQHRLSLGRRTLGG